MIRDISIQNDLVSIQQNFLQGALYSLHKASQVTWQNRLSFTLIEILWLLISQWLITKFLAPVC